MSCWQCTTVCMYTHDVVFLVAFLKCRVLLCCICIVHDPDLILKCVSVGSAWIYHLSARWCIAKCSMGTQETQCTVAKVKQQSKATSTPQPEFSCTRIETLMPLISMVFPLSSPHPFHLPTCGFFISSWSTIPPAIGSLPSPTSTKNKQLGTTGGRAISKDFQGCRPSRLSLGRTRQGFTLHRFLRFSSLGESEQLLTAALIENETCCVTLGEPILSTSLCKRHKVQRKRSAMNLLWDVSHYGPHGSRGPGSTTCNACQSTRSPADRQPQALQVLCKDEVGCIRSGEMSKKHGLTQLKVLDQFGGRNQTMNMNMVSYGRPNAWTLLGSTNHFF